MVVWTKWARAALSHSAFTGISRNHLDRLVVELADPFDSHREGRLHRRRGERDRQVSAAVRQIRPLLATRGFATTTGVRLRTLADVFAYAQAEGIKLRLDGTEIQVRRPKANRPGRRAFVSGKKKQNTIKATMVCDAQGRPLWVGAVRPGRMHDQTAVKTEGIDDLFDRHPHVQALVDAGYRGLAKAHPDQVAAPPLTPKKDAPPEDLAAYEAARTSQSSQRIPAEHAIASLKWWRTLQRFTGRRDVLPVVIAAVAELASDRAADR